MAVTLALLSQSPMMTPPWGSYLTTISVLGYRIRPRGERCRPVPLRTEADGYAKVEEAIADLNKRDVEGRAAKRPSEICT